VGAEGECPLTRWLAEKALRPPWGSIAEDNEAGIPLGELGTTVPNH